MIKRVISYFVFVLFFSIPVFSQDDTLKSIQVQGVEVQGRSLNSKDPNLLNLTDDLLENIPCVTLIKRGNFAQEPTIRGLNAGQINLSIDGMQLFGACTDRMDPISSYIEPNNLESMELNLDGQNQFTSNIGGGINFKLQGAKLNASKPFSGKIASGYESNANAYQVLSALQYSRKKWAIQGNYIYRKAQNYFAGGRQEILFSQFQKWNLGINAIVQLTSNQTLKLDYIQDNGTNIGYPALLMDVSFANAKIGAITYQLKRSGKRFYLWESKVYGNYIDHAMDDTKRPIETIGMHMDMPGTSLTAGFFSKTSWKIGKSHYLKIGLNGYRNQLHAEMTMYPSTGSKMFMLTIPDVQRQVLGIDLSDQFVYKKWDFLYGGRLEWSNSQVTTRIGEQTLSSFYKGNSLTKNAGIYSFFVKSVYNLSQKWSFNGGIQKAMRNAILQEMYGFYLFNRLDSYDYIGNPAIKPEESWNFNMGTKYKTNKWTFELKGFAYQFKNYIVGEKRAGFSGMTFGSKGVKQYVNISQAGIYGGEFSASIQLLKSLTFQTSNAISVGLDNEKAALPFIPPFTSTNQLNYTFKKYSAQLKYRTASAQNRVNTVKYGERSTPSFHVFDVQVGRSFQFEKTRLELKLALENMFDSRYYEHLDVMKINRMGRNWSVQCSFIF